MSCSFTGHADMYGVGIRIGFYLLWFGVLLASWLVPRETSLLRNLLLLYMLATFLALIIHIATSLAALAAVEVYLLLLLCYGTYYAFLPLYLWRLLTGCSPFWDPGRWPRVPSARTWSVINILALLAMSIFAMWFWITGLGSMPTVASLSSSPSSSCTDHAFFFAEVPLANQLFIALNVLISIVLLLACVLEVALAARIVRHPRWLRRKIRKARRRGISDERRGGLELLQGVFRATVASLLVAAVELTIQWNDIQGVNDAGSAAQLIPLLVAAGMLARVAWVALVRGGSDDDSSDGGDSGGETE